MQMGGQPPCESGPKAEGQEPLDAAAELANLQRDIELFQAENRNLKRLLGERNSQLEDIRASTSWRITAPLRTLRL
jgi:hypothetical protein